MCCADTSCATVYHPINSNDGKTCLSENKQTLITREGWNKRPHTLIATRNQEAMVHSLQRFVVHRKLKRIHDLHLSPILSSQQSTYNCRFISFPMIAEDMRVVPKGLLMFFCNFNRVKCSEMFKMGRGCLVMRTIRHRQHTDSAAFKAGSQG